MHKSFPFYLKWGFITILLILTGVIWIANRTIRNSARENLFSNTTDIPYNRVGLLLGTSKYLNSGKPNQYFIYRIGAASELFKAGKINFLVISGDNSRKNYNEPQDMKDALIESGIPAEKIYLDYAGFRTFDSVIRMNKIFGQKHFTIISQQFHNERAVYIAKKLGLEVFGFNAKDVDAYNGFKTRLREKLARVKVIIDFLIHAEPKFLGAPIEIK